MNDLDEVSLHIDAAPEVVWELVSDPTRMRLWSPSCRRCIWIGRTRGPVPGARFLGVNRRGIVILPTLNRVERVEYCREFAFRTTTHNTLWRYRLQPAGQGTLLTEQRDTSGTRAWMLRPLYTLLLGGYDNFHDELRAGMLTTLQRIKAAAESDANRCSR
ncbi:SRPBCC family protein [Streptomyces sp. NPDC051907]|uniref:SRPBCC family protein n=1 Tax=Streptomyces sp. NPDC051907 TaxID=3155284 RepID=UPI0034295286